MRNCVFMGTSGTSALVIVVVIDKCQLTVCVHKQNAILCQSTPL